MATGALSSKAKGEAAAHASPLDAGSRLPVAGTSDAPCAGSVRPIDCEVIGLDSPSRSSQLGVPARMSIYRHILLVEHPYGWRMRHMLRSRIGNCVPTMGFHPLPAGWV